VGLNVSEVQFKKAHGQISLTSGKVQRLDVQGDDGGVTLSGAVVRITSAVSIDELNLLQGTVSGEVTIEVPDYIHHSCIKDKSGIWHFSVLSHRQQNPNRSALILKDEDFTYVSPIVLGKDDRTINVALLRNLLSASVSDELLRSASWAKLILSSAVPGECPTARAYIENSWHVPGHGWVTVGWIAATDDSDVWLSTSSGVSAKISKDNLFQRQDVEMSLPFAFRQKAKVGGFLIALPGNEQSPGKVTAIATHPGGATRLHDIKCATFAFTVPAYIETIIGLIPKPSLISETLTRNDGFFVDALVSAVKSYTKNTLGVETWQFVPKRAEETSIIVPVYGTLRCLKEQLVAAASEPEVQSGQARLHYIIDDPRLRQEMEGLYDYVQALQLPASFHVLSANLGFAGACNQGAALAKGKNLIFLNSDCIPTDKGWIDAMISPLAKDVIGAVGARLLFPDGSIQHDGMEFTYDRSLRLWLNDHPGKGLDPFERPVLEEVESATAACVALRAATFKAVGGFDEGFVIGDFEDSSLCLALRDMKKKIVIQRKATLVHLERQSLVLSGTPTARQAIVYYNAWRHQAKHSNIFSKKKAGN
jgi:O-antigen biosynthesis protein